MKKLLSLAALFSSIAFAASTYTTHYLLEKPADGDTNWGSAYRTSLNTIDTQMFVNASAIADHIADPTAAHAATAISTTAGPTVCTSYTNVQTFLNCLDAQIGIATGVGGEVATTNTVQTFTAAKSATALWTFGAGLTVSAGTTLLSGAATLQGATTLSSLTTGLLHSDAGGLLSSSLLVNADISASAAIARSKIAAGTASSIVTNDGAGLLSSETFVPVNMGGSGAITLTSHGLLIGHGTSAVTATTAGTSGQLTQSKGASADPDWTTATYPSTATSAGTFLRADGTNWLTSTLTLPNTTTANRILFSSSTSVVGEITSANTSALVTNSSGVPALTSCTTANRVLRTDGTTLSCAQVAAATDISGVLPTANGGRPTTLGQQISGSAGTFTIATFGTPTDVTNLSVTITTTGRPVYLALIPDGTTNPALLALSTSAGASTGSCTFTFLRDASIISYQFLQFISSATGHASAVPVGSMLHIDPVGAGTYTYKMQATANAPGAGSTACFVNYAKMVAFEL